jgi:hypothetical protein
MFNALLELDVMRHPGGATTVWSGAAGVAYTIDVARAVPYAGFLGGAYFVRGAVDSSAVHLQFALGLDYQLERHWAVGVQFRVPVATITPSVHTFFTLSDSQETTGFATSFLRFQYSWGF